MAEQLQHALNSRVVIEQAKGVVAERGAVSMGEAFTLLRTYARGYNRGLNEVAKLTIEGSLSFTELRRGAAGRSSLA